MLSRNIAVFLLSCLCTFLAQADDCSFFQPRPIDQFHPLVRAEYSFLSIETLVEDHRGTHLARLPSPYNGLGFSGGFKYGKYIGLDIGFDYYFNSRRFTQTGTTTYFIGLTPETWHSDVVGYFPMLNIKGLDIVGTAGAIVTDFSFIVDDRGTGTTTYHDNVNLNLRLGLGMRWLFSQHWGVDWMYHFVPNHINTRRNGSWKSLWSVDLGLIYQIL